MYEDFYNLTGKPFQLNPDPRFFFGSRGHARAMAYLEYGVGQAEGFIVITGEVGAGKTTLVRRLLDTLDRETLIAVQLVSTQFEPDELLRAVAGAFGLDTRGSKASLLLEIEAFLIDSQRAGKRALLLVDEVQSLKPAAIEELRMLSNFQHGYESLLQSFLLGQPEFRTTLQSAGMLQLRQRVTATYHLGPMDQAETSDYIRHRLSHVGWIGNPSFSEGAFEAIFKYAGGIPRRINTVCDRLLLMGFLEEMHHFDAEHVEEVVSGLEQDFGMSADVEATGGVGLDELDDSRGEADLSAKDRMAKLEARVSRLERYVVSTTNLNRQMMTLVAKNK